MEKLISVELAQAELNRINKNMDEIQEAILGLLDGPCYVCEVLLAALVKEAVEAGRTLAGAGYVNAEDLLRDFMADSQQKEEKA